MITYDSLPLTNDFVQIDICVTKAVILAEAKQVKTDILVTLDKKHFLQEKVTKFLSPQQILTPKMLLEMIKNSKG